MKCRLIGKLLQNCYLITDLNRLPNCAR